MTMHVPAYDDCCATGLPPCNPLGGTPARPPVLFGMGERLLSVGCRWQPRRSTPIGGVIAKSGGSGRLRLPAGCGREPAREATLFRCIDSTASYSPSSRRRSGPTPVPACATLASISCGSPRVRSPHQRITSCGLRGCRPSFCNRAGSAGMTLEKAIRELQTSNVNGQRTSHPATAGRIGLE